MKILRATVALLMLSGFAEELQSQIILQFEPPHNLVGGGVNLVGVYGIEEDGFIFSAPRDPQFANGGGLLFRDPPSGLGNLNGLNTVPYDGSYYAVPFTSSQPVLKQVRGLPFQLQSMDLAPYSASFSVPNTFAVTGYYATGGTITMQVVWNGQVQGQVSDFQTFHFGELWTGLDHVVMFASLPGASGVGFSVDNIKVSTIPEPGTLTLVSLTLLSLRVTLRHRASR